MEEGEKQGADADKSTALATDNHSAVGALDPRIRAVARAIGRQMARERFAALAGQSANDNRSLPDRRDEG